MKAQIKNAVMTTAIVLATVYLLRKVSFTKNVIDTALNG